MRKVVPRLCSLKEQIPSSPVTSTQIVPMCVAEVWVGRAICCQDSSPVFPWFPPPKISQFSHQAQIKPRHEEEVLNRTGEEKQVTVCSIRGEKPGAFQKAQTVFCLHLSQWVLWLILTLQAVELWPSTQAWYRSAIFKFMSLFWHFQISVKEGCHRNWKYVRGCSKDNFSKQN